ncbi:hypothetical protein F5X68DRAFT_189418 [Plectosphaerella plurivora]|uniref:Uncharacterized protein n=1 Tax=Plectosphaerella plurivora TaxID=936078 RepID=A0A9P8VDM0_9PEZI|nr:hypothetical protein F5X68DRAFT_189418 [Plectosphaerella plurivora]
MSWLPGHPVGCQCRHCLKMTAALLQNQPVMSPCVNTSFNYGAANNNTFGATPMETPMHSGTGFCNKCFHPVNGGNTWQNPSQGYASSLPDTPLSTSAPMPNFDGPMSNSDGSMSTFDNPIPNFDDSIPNFLGPRDFDLNSVDLSDCDLSDVDVAFSDCGQSVASGFPGDDKPAFTFSEEDLQQFTSFAAINGAPAGLTTPTASAPSLGGCTLVDESFDQQTPKASNFPPLLQTQFYNSEEPVDMDVQQDLGESFITPVSLELDASTPRSTMPPAGEGTGSHPTLGCRDLDFLEEQNQSDDLSGFYGRGQGNSSITPDGPCPSPVSDMSDACAQEFVVDPTSLLETLHDINMEMGSGSDSDSDSDSDEE